MVNSPTNQWAPNTEFLIMTKRVKPGAKQKPSDIVYLPCKLDKSSRNVFYCIDRTKVLLPD